MVAISASQHGNEFNPPDLVRLPDAQQNLRRLDQWVYATPHPRRHAAQGHSGTRHPPPVARIAATHLD